MVCFSPRNGEVILKLKNPSLPIPYAGFSPRNGEVILKVRTVLHYLTDINVSVPAMGK